MSNQVHQLNFLTMKNFLIIVFIISASAAQAQQIVTDFESQKKRIVKMEFFSPLTGKTTVGYEQYIKDWMSWEAKVGLIGLGIDPAEKDPAGFMLRVGPKFKLNPDFVTDGMKGSHLLSGKYIKPEIAFSAYSENEQYDELGNPSGDREDYTSMAILVNYGRQYVLADVMSLDYHIGLGYGFDNEGGGRYNYSHSNGGKDFPVAISAGFSIGFLLK